jgi:hypothetical protein
MNKIYLLVLIISIPNMAYPKNSFIIEPFVNIRTGNWSGPEETSDYVLEKSGTFTGYGIGINILKKKSYFLFGGSYTFTNSKWKYAKSSDISNDDDWREDLSATQQDIAALGGLILGKQGEFTILYGYSFYSRLKYKNDLDPDNPAKILIGDYHKVLMSTAFFSNFRFNVEFQWGKFDKILIGSSEVNLPGTYNSVKYKTYSYSDLSYYFSFPFSF